MSKLQCQVRKDQLDAMRCVELADEPLAAGEVRVRIDLAAYTANNITYAAFGEAMQYWQFFPVPPAADGTAWGCIPVWGFGEVVQSQHPGVAVGERLWGYWPMASHAVLQPTRLTPQGFADGSAHRAALHAVYNAYARCAADPYHTADSEAAQALLRPLFLTAWLIDDFLADNAFFGSTQDGARPMVLLSSASSKTAWATAAQLARRPEVEVVGLTSAANVGFCRSLGLYSRVLSYDEVPSLPADAPAVYVDFAGNGGLRQAIHARLVRLAYSCAVGGTHVRHLAGARDLPGPRPVLFFAPAQVKKRRTDWGGAELDSRLVQAWHAFRQQASRAVTPWLLPQWHRGPSAVQAAHALLLQGGADPRIGHLINLQA